MDLTIYSPTVRILLTDERVGELGPGRPNQAMRSALQAMTLESLFGPGKLTRPELGQCCLSALWLYHDFLDESHTISQDIACVEGSWWHGIMHRREPDYGNAAYWFRRVGNHAVFEPLRKRAAQLATDVGTPGGSEFLTRQTTWDPFPFIDLCEASAHGRGGCEMLCRLVQNAEWELLFAYCFEHAR